MATLRQQDASTAMKIVISMEMTRLLRQTWHAAINHEWWEFLHGQDLVPVCCHGPWPDLQDIDLVILAGGNDMADICTWRDNHYSLRDQFEHDLIAHCIGSSTPVVGICRGFHFMNWTQGGTHKLMTDPYDSVSVKLSRFTVTCHHTIQIDNLAEGFEVLDQDSYGVIELAVDRSKRLMGIGWHPERAVNCHTRPAVLEMIATL